jgi:NAD(P)H-hydrate epimerase
MTAGYPVVDVDAVGWLTETEMIEVDRVMAEDLGIELIQMMENAGRNLAQLVVDLFAPGTATVLAGSGGNGGGGLVAARHLANRGVDVTVTLGQRAGAMGPVPAHQFDILERMGLPVHPEPRRADVVVDALIGYSLKGEPRGRIGELIGWVGEVGGLVVSLDTPSGVNVTEGSVPGVAVDADATMTLALPKIGLRHAPQVGELYVADISVPPSVFATIGVDPAPDFSKNSIIHVIDSTESSRT